MNRRRARWMSAAGTALRSRAPWAFATAVACLAALIHGCGQMSAGTCVDTATCMPDASASTVSGPGEAGPTGDGGDAAAPPPDAQCDPSLDPSVESCLVADTYGVFVSPDGGDANPGTREKPVRTIGQGIRVAVANVDAGTLASPTRVFVCQGTYDEQVTIGKVETEGASIGLYGGFDCSSWGYKGGPPTPDAGPIVIVQGPGPLYALDIESTQLTVTIEDMAFTVPDAGPADGGAGGSSIAAFVNLAGSPVTLVRDAFIAGAGSGAANPGAPPTNWFSSNLDASAGNGPDGAAGGAEQVCPCVQGESTGGAGGNAGNPAGDGGSGTATPAAAPQGLQTGTGGVGYNASTPNLCSPGFPG
ncbi:MAG TPA: hypothetical protein VEK07_06885, partial [Polyangiaceae bacterium]|nr:hypothetical protein [Polyangiaceae bacterium]